MPLTQEERARLEAKVTAAEQVTAVEIVPMVVGGSSAIGHVPTLLLLLFLVLGLSAEVMAEHVWEWRPPFLWWMAYLVLSFVAVRLLTPCKAIQRWLTDQHDLRRQVHERAWIEFYSEGLHQTQGHTGILIFVSLMEHQAEVLVDRSIAKELAPEVWQKVVQEIVRGIQTKGLAHGLEVGIDLCVETCRGKFPARERRNELSNHVVIKD